MNYVKTSNFNARNGAISYIFKKSAAGRTEFRPFLKCEQLTRNEVISYILKRTRLMHE